MGRASIAAALPIVLIVGGIAAPLAVAELTGARPEAPALGVRIAPAADPGATFTKDAFLPTSTGTCSFSGGVIALDNAPAAPADPYARPVAEGTAPDAAALGVAPVVIGTELRVGEPVVGVGLGLEMTCKGERDYRSGVPAVAPFHT